MEDLLRITPLHPRFGVEIHEVDLRRLTADQGYPAIRQAFETHSLLLFRDQQLDDAAHLALGALFGPIEDRSQGKTAPIRG
jgi:alpha-ketoglutarate-dependent 2,4-dichlorophenoxyacetate dioxygenase